MLGLLKGKLVLAPQGKRLCEVHYSVVSEVIGFWTCGGFTFTRGVEFVSANKLFGC